MYLLYSFLLTLVVVLGAPYWLYKAFRERKYFGSFAQRIGLRLPEMDSLDRPLWIHAVSVGEVLAVKPLLSALEGIRSDLPVVVSTITITGNMLAVKETNARARPFYFPFDWVFSVIRFLNRVQPRAVVLMETELWPNFLNCCRRRGVPVFVANGRLSGKSFARYRRFSWLVKPMLDQVRIIGVQTHEDKKRFLELGAKEDRIRVTGNLKFDFPTPALDGQRELLQNVRSCLGLNAETHVIVVGSSMRGEENIFLEAYRETCRSLSEVRLILAPRHPERFDEVAGILRKSGLAFRRRSRLDADDPPHPRVLLLDTIGELRAIYSLASVAVVGGSFLPFGGHNLLEPAAFGKAIIFGPYMSNFQEMARVFLHEQAARQASPETLARALVELLLNPRGRDMLGHRALLTIRQNQGATRNTLDFLLEAV